MLTVKIIQDGITKIYESENFCFYDETSDEYRLALSLADRLNESPVDLTSIFYTQPLFSDENCQETIREEEIYCSARNNSADKIVGVLIDVIPDEQYGKHGVDKEVIYSLISNADHIYVTNEQGKTVFSI